MKHLGKSFFITLLLISFSINVLALGPKGNWTERFNLKGGNYIEHTPEYISINGSFPVRKEIHMMRSSFNGIIVSSPCGLHLKTDSTREEFVEALHCAGLY